MKSPNCLEITTALASPGKVLLGAYKKFYKISVKIYQKEFEHVKLCTCLNKVKTLIKIAELNFLKINLL